MKLLEEELELDTLDLVEANDLNHNLFGPLSSVGCEAWQMLDGKILLSGTGFGADRWGGDHEMQFEIIIDRADYDKLIA